MVYGGSEFSKLSPISLIHTTPKIYLINKFKNIIWDTYLKFCSMSLLEIKISPLDLSWKHLLFPEN